MFYGYLQGGKMKKRIVLITGGLLVILLALFISFDNVALASLCAVMGTLLIGFDIFEKKEVTAEKLVLISVLSAISTAGRVLFSSIPSVNPSSFIIIMTGVVFGPSSGFMTGAITALASNMILGHGPWTPWQMILWGAMGFLSGILARPLKKHNWLRIAYGFMWGLIFGWGMNFFYVLQGYLTETGIKAFLIACGTSFILDFLHGAGNAVFLFVFGKGFLKIFERAALKYGLK